MRLTDSSGRPSLCTLCGNSGDDDTRFVDCEAVREGPVVYDQNTGQIATDPRGAQIVLEDVYVCEGCGSSIADLFGYVPQLHRTHLAEIRRLRARESELEDENKLLRQLVAEEVAA